jgi:hypothetical protein
MASEAPDFSGHSRGLAVVTHPIASIFKSANFKLEASLLTAA